MWVVNFELSCSPASIRGFEKNAVQMRRGRSTELQNKTFSYHNMAAISPKLSVPSKKRFKSIIDNIFKRHL